MGDFYIIFSKEMDNDMSIEFDYIIHCCFKYLKKLSQRHIKITRKECAERNLNTQISPPNQCNNKIPKN